MNTDNRGLILALDIGTNNTCGSYINPNTGRAEIIEVGSLRSIPSFFGYNHKGEEIIGLAAKKKFCDGISEVIGRAKYLVGKQIPRDAIKVYSEKCGAEIRFNQEGYCYFHLPKKGVDINPSELYKRMINLYVSLLQRKVNGHAEKRQMQFMVKNVLGLKSIPKPDDAADALAVAICHSQINPRLNFNMM